MYEQTLRTEDKPQAPPDYRAALERIGASWRMRERRPREGNPFRAAKPMPGVLPKTYKRPRFAMDQAGFTGWCGQGGGWEGGYQFLTQGYSFLGYPALAEMAQVAEFRVISECIATEMTRKWIEFKAVGDGKDPKKSKAKAKSSKIKTIEDELKRLSAQNLFSKLVTIDGQFGRAHLYLDTDDTDNLAELTKPIGDGTERQNSDAKVNQKHPLKALRVIEPMWTYPAIYNSNNPMRDDWFHPVTWFVMGNEIHRSRLLRFVMREVPDMLKPAYSFGGLSLSQMALPYVNNWLRTRQSVADIIHSFSIMILATDMIRSLQPQSDILDDRINLFNAIRDNKGMLTIDKSTEDFKNVSAPLGTLDALQAQTQEHMAAVSRIPLVKLLGITPSGLNASTEGEIRVFEDTIHSAQEYFIRPGLTTVINFIQLSQFGSVDPEITFDFVPLHTLDELQLATKRKTEAETHQVYVDMGAVAQSEVRQAVADDPDTPYPGLNADELPVSPAENMPDTLSGRPVGARHILATPGKPEKPDEEGAESQEDPEAEEQREAA